MEFQIFSISIVGVNKGFPHSPIVIGLCIDELEQMVDDIATKDGIKEVVIGNVIVMHLFYADDVALFQIL